MNEQFIDISVSKMPLNDLVVSNVDSLAVEEPLDIRLVFNNNPKGETVSITMRTPGSDRELAAGFLFTEGILKEDSQLESIRLCPIDTRKFAYQNTIKVKLIENSNVDITKLKRNFYTSSSCGVCGKTSIEALKVTGANLNLKSDLMVNKDFLYNLHDELNRHQNIFKQTGGLHASALFDKVGKYIKSYEDVGRHNALDKLIGDCFLNDELPLTDHILLLSGRISFELVQKAAMAGVKFICALGAPSSLAVELAKEFNITLIGFLKKNKFNIYHGANRII